MHPYLPVDLGWNDGTSGVVYYWDNVPTPSSRLLVGDNQNGAIWTWAHLSYRHGKNDMVNMSLFDGHTEPLNTKQAPNSFNTGTF